jgi:hypothetical protein
MEKFQISSHTYCSVASSEHFTFVGFEVLTVVMIGSTFTWDVMPYSVIEIHWCFGAASCSLFVWLTLQSWNSTRLRGIVLQKKVLFALDVTEVEFQSELSCNAPICWVHASSIWHHTFLVTNSEILCVRIRKLIAIDHVCHTTSHNFAKAACGVSCCWGRTFLDRKCVLPSLFHSHRDM